MATFRSQPTIPPDIITYRLDDKLVYVRPADNYEEALDIAQKEYPDELSQVPRERIAFSKAATVSGQRHVVRISESAWVGAVSRLLRGEVIDIQVRSPPHTVVLKDEPPQYLETQNTKTELDAVPQLTSLGAGGPQGRAWRSRFLWRTC